MVCVIDDQSRCISSMIFHKCNVNASFCYLYINVDTTVLKCTDFFYVFSLSASTITSVTYLVIEPQQTTLHLIELKRTRQIHIVFGFYTQQFAGIGFRPQWNAFVLRYFNPCITWSSILLNFDGKWCLVHHHIHWYEHNLLRQRIVGQCIVNGDLNIREKKFSFIHLFDLENGNETNLIDHIIRFTFHNASRSSRIQCKTIAPFTGFDPNGCTFFAEKNFFTK